MKCNAKATIYGLTEGERGGKILFIHADRGVNTELSERRAFDVELLIWFAGFSDMMCRILAHPASHLVGYLRGGPDQRVFPQAPVQSSIFPPASDLVFFVTFTAPEAFEQLFKSFEIPIRGQVKSLA